MMQNREALDPLNQDNQDVQPFSLVDSSVGSLQMQRPGAI